MDKKILVLTVTLFAVSAYAQNNAQNEYVEWKPSQNEYTNFDIGQYTTPDIARNLLNMDFGFRTDYSRNDYSYPDRNNMYESSNLAGNFSSSFSHYVNTRKKISTLYGNLSFGENYLSQKDELTYTNTNSTTFNNESSLILQNALNLSWSNKWYFSNLFFMDYGLQSSVSYNFTHEKTKNHLEDSYEKQKRFSSYISPQLGVGYGRIENVKDARQAVYIANALSKKKVLTRNLSNDELFELSQIISTVKNKRFLDARLHLIEEITTLDSFFEDNELLADNGAAYFTTLYDMWQFGDLFSRQSGYEISFILRPNYSHQTVKYTPEIQDMIINANQHIMSLNFSYEKPFKLNWQHSLSTEVFGGIHYFSDQNKQIDDSKNSTKYNSFSAMANYSLGYYPNTRTNIRITTTQQISKNIFDDERRYTNFYSVLSANLYYYFSPNLRLAGECWLRYSPSRNKVNEEYYANRNTFSSSFNIQLTYFIF